MSSTPDLVVGRDRAHVRSLLLEDPPSEVISASAFFDIVRMLIFFANHKVERDDYASKIIAQRILQESFGLW